MMTNLTVKADLGWDYDLMRHDFEENFKQLKDGKFLFLDYGNLSDHFDETDFFEIDFDKTKKSSINALKIELYCNSYVKNEVPLSYDLDELISVYLYNNHTLQDVERLLNEYKITYYDKYEEFTVRDYQDVYTILLNIEEAEEVWGKSLEYDEMQEYLNRLINDVPIYGDIFIKFNYINNNNIGGSYGDILEFYDISNNMYKLDFNEDQIIDAINDNLINYKLSDSEANAVLEAFDNIEDTDIKG